MRPVAVNPPAEIGDDGETQLDRVERKLDRLVATLDRMQPLLDAYEQRARRGTFGFGSRPAKGTST